MRAYVDESSCIRSPELQEYLLAAALIDVGDEEAIRDELRPLLLPGQVKLHWSDESASRRRRIAAAIAGLGTMNVVVAHLSMRQRTTERFRRKCLETMYYELVAAGVFEAVLESRGRAQDKKDLALLVALKGQGLSRDLHIDHVEGGADPLLWIADGVLGALNAAHLGEPAYAEALQSTVVLDARTPDSLAPDVEASERPEVQSSGWNSQAFFPIRRNGGHAPR